MRTVYNKIPFEKRFWKHVSKTDSCWIWTGAKDKKGYGRLSIWVSETKKIPRLAHRISLVIHEVKFEENDCVLHKCDNPSCVNPQHLFIGDRQLNVDDMIYKNRMPRGEERPNVKLSESDVLEIRRKYVRWSYGISKLAKDFNVSCRLIQGILSGTRWKHIK